MVLTFQLFQNSPKSVQKRTFQLRILSVSILLNKINQNIVLALQTSLISSTQTSPIIVLISSENQLSLKK